MMTWFRILFAFVIIISCYADKNVTANPSGMSNQENQETCRVVVAEKNARLKSELVPICTATYRRMAGQLGLRSEATLSPVTVRIVSHPRDMESQAPPGAEPPSWSNAVAYPEHKLILMSLHNRMGSPVKDLDVVLEHELSHLALRQVIAGANVPRWYSEGIAIQQSERSSFRRYWLVWLAARGDNLLPMATIERYPDETGKINLAYAQAADFVGYLLRREGWLGVRIVLREVAKGRPFEEAFEFAYREKVAALELGWRQGLGSRWQLLPLITGTGALWGFIVVLFLVAYTAVKRRKQKRLKEMEAEEAALIEAQPRPATHSRPPTRRRGPDISQIPTKIRIDDEIHTLH